MSRQRDDRHHLRQITSGREKSYAHYRVGYADRVPDHGGHPGYEIRRDCDPNDAHDEGRGVELPESLVTTVGDRDEQG